MRLSSVRMCPAPGWRALPDSSEHASPVQHVMGCPGPTPGPVDCDQGRSLDRVSRVVKGEASPQRDVVSFVRRSARMNPSQQRAWRDHRMPYLVEIARGPMSTSVAPQEPLDWPEVFGRTAPLIVEIGAGNGDSLVATAAAHPDTDIIGFEVFEPSIASTLSKLAARNLMGARIVLADSVQGLRWLVQ